MKIVADSADRARRGALQSDIFPTKEAELIVETLSGARLPERVAIQYGPERCGAVYFSTAIVLLASMLAGREGETISVAGSIDDLRYAQPPRPKSRDVSIRRLLRRCLYCGKPFDSAWIGNRICRACLKSTENPF